MDAGEDIFQSTLPHGERPYSMAWTCDNSYFNPRSRTGSDNDLPSTQSHLPPISIHAPARGATLSSSSHHPLAHNFNPRSRTGSDAKNSIFFSDYGILFIQYIQIKAFFISFKPFFHPISYILSVRVPPAFHVSLWFAPAKSSMSLPLRKKTWHQNAQPWSGNCFPNDKSAGYLRFH